MINDTELELIRTLVKTDQIRMLVRGQNPEERGERHGYFFATQLASEVLAVLGISKQESQKLRETLKGYDFDEHTYYISPESLAEKLGTCCYEDTFRGIKQVPVIQQSAEPAFAARR